MKKQRLKRQLCLNEALKNEDLLPIQCLDIMEKVYNKQLNKMKPTVIASIMRDMMAKCTDVNYDEEIQKVITDWIFE